MEPDVIRCEGLGKRYLIRHQAGQASYRRFSEDLTAALARPFRRRPAGSGEAGQTKEWFWALRDVGFGVKRGEAIGIIGRNGAGKSTLLKVLSRITEPTEGRVRIRGRVASLLEVGTGFHPELTGRENIFLNGTILGMTRREIQGKFDEIVAFAEIEKFLDTPVKRYSSGMYVRLAFAVAAHLEPEILIVDEVLAVGDVQFQKKCLGKMQDVSRAGGRTVLFVSHNMSAIQTLCGRAMLLEGGRVAAVGETDEVVQGYLASARERGAAAAEGVGSMELGPALLLREMRFEPTAVVSCDPVSFSIEIAARGPVHLREMAVLVYSDLGTRVAVLDLRRAGASGLALVGGRLAITGRIRSLPLVEGDYRMGLFIATGDYHGNYFDLATVSVIDDKSVGGIVPYPPAYRGFANLDFEAEVKSR